MPGVLVSFLELHFLALLALVGRPQPLKKPSQSQKGHFYEKMEGLSLIEALHFMAFISIEAPLGAVPRGTG